MSTNLKVPFLDLSISHKKLKSEIISAIEPIVESGEFILGQEVETLEKKIADYCGTKYAIGVNSGTDALILSLKALNIGPGDEVITTANSFIATMLSISAVGATPVLVDINKTYNIDPLKIERAITHKTKAIMPVYYTGRMAEMDTILNIARKYSIPVIEDAAQAMGAEYKGKKAGSFGIFGCFSFFPTKNLSACGDGGMITTNNKELHDKLKLLRNFGRKTRDTWAIRGINTRLDTIQAAILLVKMKYLNEWNNRRIEIAECYNSMLKDLTHVPESCAHEKQIYHLYILRTKGVTNIELQEYLLGEGIDTRIHYPIPMYLQEAYRDSGYKKDSFPIVEGYSKEFLTLPIFPDLTQDQVNYVVDKIKNFYEARSR